MEQKEKYKKGLLYIKENIRNEFNDVMDNETVQTDKYGACINIYEIIKLKSKIMADLDVLIDMENYFQMVQEIRVNDKKVE